jgi:serine/threonine-protein kinase
VGIAFLYRRTADPVRFRLPSTMIGFFLPTIAVAAAIPYFGAFSPAPLLVVLAVYFTGLGSSVRLAVAVWVVCAVSQAVTAGLIITGVTRDTGLVQGASLPVRTQLMIQLLVQMVMLGTFILARVSRRSALLAVSELERATRVASQREALLLEARQELDRALRSGRGRFSDQVIAGYELGDVIGRGAMGEVYAATDPRTGDGVAVKLLSSASLGNPQHVQRFFRELTTAAGLSSPNVVRVIEIGERPVPFLVMERLEGKSLAELLRRRRTLPVDQLVELVRHVGTGLAAAAAAGVIHRDIKPQNLYSHHGVWKILDFGVSRLAESGETLTSGQIVGTPAYMAPEQARGATVDHRTDLYALAAVAYRAHTGQPPFAARELADTLYRVVHTAPRRPSLVVPTAADLELVLAIGLAKQADERFATADELVAAFADAVAGALPDALRARGGKLVAAGAWAD